MAKNATRSWTYEERNLSVTKSMPDAGDTVAYSYDALQRPQVKTQQDSSTITMIYDLAGRMIEREYSDSTSDTFAYDGAGRLLSATKGRHAITTTRSYFADGMMESETQTLDGRAYTLQRSYDARNLVASQTFADGKVMTWTHDSRRLVTAASYDGDPVLSQQHDAGYRLTQQSFANGLTRDIHFGRDDNMRTGDTVSDTGVIDELSFTYGYAPDKSVLSETQINGILEDLSFTAAYDPGNRVISYNRADSYLDARETQSWNYDGAGNWNSTVIDGNTQNRTHSASDQLEVIAGDNLTYDAKGNQLTDNRDNEYTWDIDNRIVKSEGSGYSDIEYRYDALGRRIVRKQGTSKEVLLWWGNTEQAEHKHQAGQTTIQNDLQADPSEDTLNTIFARALEGNKLDIQYFHKNYLNHVMAVSDDNGNILEHYRYTAFGEPEIYSPTGTKLTATAIDNDILWNVRRYESGNGLYMYLYRDYDAATGRWPSRDPIAERGGVNLYGFVANDAVNDADSFGLIPVEGWEENPIQFIEGILPNKQYGQTQFAILALIKVDSDNKCCLEAELRTVTGPKILYDKYQITRDGKSLMVVMEHEMEHYHALVRRFTEVKDSIVSERTCYDTPEEAAEQAVLLEEYFNMLIIIHLENEGSHDTESGYGTPDQP